MIEELVKLTKSISSSKQERLVDHVTKLFVPLHASKKKLEMEAFNSLLSGVFDDVSRGSRQIIADRLGAREFTSADLAMKVAMDDDIQIARPALEKSPVLTHAQLMKIAKVKGQDHLMALTKRDHIDPKLAKLILKRGGKNVRESLAQNVGAEISQEDFQMIVKDLPNQLGDKIRHLRKSNQQLVQELFNDTAGKMSGPELEPGKGKIPLKQWFSGIRGGHISIEKAISQLCMEKNLYDVAALLSVASGIDQKYMNSLIIRYDSTGIAIVCRAIGIPDMDYSSICKARCHHLKFPVSTGNKWLTNYHVLDPLDAKRFLGLMKLKLRTMAEKAA
ncbi:MAG: DUF2336 domain-containing protein [Rhodobacteraceae bacterium]|nr:DUF2336 domain-containing protein [Paracoccaceae bacterium]